MCFMGGGGGGGCWGAGLFLKIISCKTYFL